MINIDQSALRALLNDAGVTAAGYDLAREIAADVDVGSVTEAQVVVRPYTTRRGTHAHAVSIQHPAGLALEAKHGSLTKSAALHGLQVRSR